MRIPFRLVDVFTDRPLAGNQLCVIPDASGLAGNEMQAIASEIGFSETTFVTQTAPDRYSMRIFTPETELPFAGHPSLGTALRLGSGRSRGQCGYTSGRGWGVSDGGRRDGSVRADAAASSEVRAAAADAGSPRGRRSRRRRSTPGPPSGSRRYGAAALIVPARDADAVSRADPDARRLAALLRRFEAEGFYLFCFGEGRVRARMFAPAIGVPEDAATGSAAGPLGAYLVRHHLVPRGGIVISQGVELGRPSTLFVDVQVAEPDWEVWVSGGVVKVGEGSFDLPF